MTTRITRTIKALAAALLCLASTTAFAQGDYPSRPIRIIVPYAAGGGADILSRLLGQRLGDRLKQPVIVENQGGGSNTIGMSAVAHAARDGYTLGLATPVFVMTPSLMKTHPYDIFKDFTPVAMIGFTPLVLVVHPSVPAKNLQEFVALGKSKPGTLNFASLGQATTQGLAGTLFNMMTGIDAVQIPYKGSAPGTADLLAGNVQYMFNALPSELGHIQAGRLRALGVSSLKRSPSLPDVPPINDTVKGYDVTTWYSLVAPAGTPPEIVDKLNREIVAITESPAIREKLREQGVEADAMTPAQLGAHLQKEHDRWAKVIRDAKIQPE
ncbi:MAG TPA: tripartite tricarboxylate transporter substrate binding protein [Usitatibacter sp.]|jgi:tripartite-type tricarboxylate transporter receptor subunit TctC|nr:tripartite tricarboxylate transporter substrate binding protein [Usitatibacter sp.]